MTDGWFAAVAGVMLVCSLVGAAVAATDGSGDGERAVEWTPDVPAVHGAEAPDEPGVATVGDREFDSAQAAVDAADPGETIRLEGRFQERVTVATPGVTLASEADGAVIDGEGEGTVLTVTAENVTLEGLWIRDSGYDKTDDDAGVRVTGSGATLTDLRLTEITFGVWIGDTTDVTVEETTIAGREDVATEQRGNGIHLWESEGTELRGNYVTTVRDGIYYSWAQNVHAAENVMWDLRYGVHYMYSNDNHLERNVAFDNDVGFALMVSKDLVLEENVAVRNDGPSGHGVLLKDVENSEIVGNAVVANGNGLYVYNAQNNAIADNLVLENDLGIHVTGGSQGERVTGNSFLENGQAAYATTNVQVAWNDADGGNYWSDARTVDRDGDGTSEIRHQPAGTVEALVHEEPRAGVFAESPAFDTVRLAESSFPVVESPGVVDHRPLAEPAHEDWRTYYDHEDHDH